MNGITSLLIRAALLVVVTVAGAAPAVAQEVVEYIHTDALGSPVAITDASGNVIERTVYEPYGAVVNRPLKDGPGYTGHVTDSGTGLSYMQQRYYDVETGIFLSVDPVAATEVAFGRYYYANNNPYRFTDPDGRAAEDEVKPKPQPTTLPTVNAIAPPAVLPAVPIAPMPTSLPRVPWPAIGEFAIQRVALPLLLIWSTEMGASPCEMPGAPPLWRDVTVFQR